jgi:muramoyltetrapeptide carboxypeptidase
MRYPKNLNKGDTIAIIAPAKAIEKDYVDFAVQLWEKYGYKVLVSENCLNQNNYFAGTIEERTSDLQWAFDHEEIKAVVCARGGYGCIHTVENIDWNKFKGNPKWLIGFSDVTVFHFLLSTFGIASIHGTMPLNYRENSKASIEILDETLKGKLQSFSWKTTLSKQGQTNGILIGGNLAVISDLIGTKLQPEMKGKILFLEEVGEYHYTIDRMFYQLKLAGILDEISGLIIGSFNKVGDSSPPFGETVEKIIYSHCKDLNIPVAFDFPVGHQNDNRPLKCGGSFSFLVNNGSAKLVEVKQ